MPFSRAHLVCNCDTSVDIQETMSVAAVDPVNDVVFAHPFGVNLPKTLFIIGFVLSNVSYRKIPVETCDLTLTNCIFRKSGAVLAIVSRLAAFSPCSSRPWPIK